MEENVKNQLDAISGAIDSKIEKSNAQAIELASQKSAELVKEQVSDVVAKFNERMDAMEVANKKQMNAGKKMTFKSALQEAIAKIETLETQRADLETRLTALENA